MSVINDFWEEYGDQNFIFIDQESNQHDLTLFEAKDLLGELAQENIDPESNEDFLFRTIEGKINALIQEFAKPYFQPYKCCAFRAGYSYRNNNETYNLACVFNQTTFMKNTESLVETYEHFKNEADRSGGIINC